MNKKNKKFNYKYLLISLISATIISATAIGLYTTFNKFQDVKTNQFSQNLKAITTDKIGKKVGNIRHWENNSFNGIEVKNGGFVVLTGTQSATRVDAFGNILWEFDPVSLSSQYSEFSNKKVVEVTQDKGDNQNILYLLLVPMSAPDKKAEFDATDGSNYNSMKNQVNTQATVVQIIENINSYSGSTWTPSFIINEEKIINISPEKMVNNYPTSWTTQSTTKQGENNSFFTCDDHPSWYVAQSGQSVNNTVDQNTGLNSTMVLPWKQYITNLGNMYAKDGILLMFGGNGSIFNDPEALSIGMWKLDFNTKSYTGIPYAYLLKNLNYNPGVLTVNLDIWNWNQSYVPIGQTENFSYVPRLAVGGIQTNITGSEDNFLYLAGGITVGQVKNSQSRQEVDSSGNPIVSSDSSNSEQNSTTIQDKRSLQLTGANTITNPKDTTANSIDPAILFGTAFNIESLINLSNDKINSNNLAQFGSVLANNSYFDVGATSAVCSSFGSYYFFNKGDQTNGWVGTIDNSDKQKSFDPNTSALRKYLPSPYLPTDLNAIGEVKQITSKSSNNSEQSISGASTYNAASSYAYTTNLLAENAKNYYYPTLSFGYSLKNVASLTKVKMPSSYEENKIIQGYAMQVGASILYLNEPQFDSDSIALHGNSSVIIGDTNLLGNPKYGGYDYQYEWKATDNNYYSPFNHTGYSNTNDFISRMGVSNFVRGIICFNDTVPMIAKGFKIANNSYEQNSSGEATIEPNLAWNDFVGLSSSENGSNLLSLWNDNNSLTIGKEHSILTATPQIPEVDMSTISNYVNIYPSNINQSNIDNFSTFSFSLLSSKAWFSQSEDVPGSISNSIVPSKKYMNLTSKISNNPELYFVGSDNNTTTNGIFDSLVRPKDDNVTNLFYGQIQNKTSKATSNELGISYRYIKNQFGLNVYSNVQTVNRLELLGNGEFVNSLSNQLLTNGLSSILENISLSEITGNESDKATTVKVLKNQYVNEIYKINKAPNTTGLKPGASSVLIVASNVNLISQTVTLTAYSWNSLTQSYDVMPRSNSLEINQVNNSTFTGFSAMADWILPIVIAVPIVLVALIIGLGCGIGIPMAKHKKSIQVGFELQHEKVGTLTTAVGGVFKKIIENTSANNMKAKPQMLKAGGSNSTPTPKPAAKPTSSGSPKQASNPTPKPTSKPSIN